jgi:hypothetical protein
LVLKELIDCFHDTFIATKSSTTKLGFQLRKQVEVIEPSSENMGDGEEFKSVAAAIATWDV